VGYNVKTLCKRNGERRRGKENKDEDEKRVEGVIWGFVS